MKLRFTLNGDQVCLLGVSGAPVTLHSLSPRFQQASTNWTKAPREGGFIPVFIGCEHLQKVPADWKGPFIIVEKSLDYFEFLIREGVIQPHSGAEMLFGSLGYAAPGLHPQFSYAFMEQEMLALALPLQKSLWQAKALPAFFWINGSSPPPDITEDYLFRTLKTVEATLKIHRQHASLYEAIRARNHGGTLGLYRSEEELPILTDIYDFQFKKSDLSHLNLEFEPFHKDQFLIYRGEQIPRSHLTEETILSSLAPALKRHRKILDRIQSETPRLVCFRNQSIYGGLEDALLLRLLWEACGIQAYSLWVDYQGHQFSGFDGGFLHSAAQFANEHHLTIFPLEGRHGSSKRILHYYERAYALKQSPEILEEDALDTDVAILNTFRPQAFGQESFNILFQMLKALSNLPLFIAYFVFFDALRAFFDAPGIPFKRVNFWVHLMNYMDFAFYNQVRVHYVKELVSKLSPDFTVKVYGENWDQHLPAPLCRPFTRDPESVYRKAWITVNVSPIDSYENPPSTAMHTLAAGGLPVCLKPAFKSLSGHSPFNENSLPYFSSAQDIAGLLSGLKLNQGSRRDLISMKASQVLERQNREKPGPDNLTARRLIAKPSSVLRFTDHESKDQFILLSTIGFFLELSGYFEDALELWKETTQNLKISFKPLVYHAQALAAKQGLSSYEKLFCELI